MGILTRIAESIEGAFDPVARFEKNYRPQASAIATGQTIDMKMAAGGMASVIPQMYQAWGAYGYLPSITWYQLANMYVSWTYAAINKKATTLASLPVQLFRYEKKGTGKTVLPYSIKSACASSPVRSSFENREFKVLQAMGVKKVYIEEHPCLDLMNRPNPDFVRSNFWQLMCVHLFLSGAVGIYKAKRFLGNPTELHILPATWTGNLKPIPGNGRTAIAGYKLIDLDIQEDFDKDEVIWPHYPSLRNPYEGMSPIKANLYGFDLDQYMLQQLTAFYKNGSLFSNVLSTDQILDQDVYDDIKNQVKGYQGAKNAGQMFVAHGGMKFTNPMTQTAREAMVTEIERMAREKILAGEDVSEGKLGLTAQQNKANLEVVDESFFNEAIKPAATMITEYLDKDLVSGYDERLSLEFVYPSFDDQKQKLEERRFYLSSGKKVINEYREEDGEAPVPWGDVPLISSAMMPLGEGADGPEELPGVNPPAESDDDAEETEEGEEGGEKILRGIHNKAFWTAEKKAIAWKRFDRHAKSYEPLFSKASKRLFREIQNAIIKNLESHGVKMITNIATMSRQHKLEYMGEHKEKLDAFIPDEHFIRKAINDIFKPAYKATLSGAAKDRADLLDETLDFDVNDPRVADWLGTRLETFSKNVTKTTIQNTKDILRQDFADGAGLSTMFDHLKDYFTGNENRARTIARTESVAAYNKGDLEAVEQLGLNLKKVWLAEPTARPTHAEAGEKYSEGGEPGPLETDGIFEVGSDRMIAPGNGSEAGENVNCRCSMVYVRGD